MAINERIRFFRQLRGMTLKYLGIQVGFPERSADIRMAQYESDKRTPKADLTEKLAATLQALTVPDIDSELGLMHTLFALEDLYGIQIRNLDGELCLCLDKSDGRRFHSMRNLFSEWQRQAERYRNEEISKEEYDEWRYTYPEMEAKRTKAELDELRNAKRINYPK